MFESYSVAYYFISFSVEKFIGYFFLDYPVGEGEGKLNFANNMWFKGGCIWSQGNFIRGINYLKKVLQIDRNGRNNI